MVKPTDPNPPDQAMLQNVSACKLRPRAATHKRPSASSCCLENEASSLGMNRAMAVRRFPLIASRVKRDNLLITKVSNRTRPVQMLEWPPATTRLPPRLLP